MTRKQREKDRALEKYMEEHPYKYPLFTHRLLLHDNMNRSPDLKEEARKEKANDQFIKEHPDQNPPTNCETGRNLEEEEKAENKFREEMKNHKKKVEEKAKNSEIPFYPSLLFTSFVKTNAFGVDIINPALSF